MDADAGQVDPATLDALATLDTTTVFNILKGLGRAGRDGYSGPDLRPVVPVAGSVVGFAVTSSWTAGETDAPNRDYLAYLDALEAMRGRSIAVLFDVGRDPGRSGIAGDGMMREFQVLGAGGAIVGGSVMDIGGIERLAFPVLATGVVPAYDDLRMAAMGESGRIGALRIADGDLLVVDRSGVVRVPVDAAAAVVAGVPGFRALEASVAALLDRPGVDAAAMRAWYQANEPAFLGGEETPTDALKRVVGGEG